MDSRPRRIIETEKQEPNWTRTAEVYIRENLGQTQSKSKWEKSRNEEIQSATQTCLNRIFQVHFSISWSRSFRQQIICNLSYTRARYRGFRMMVQRIYLPLYPQYLFRTKQHPTLPVDMNRNSKRHIPYANLCLRPIRYRHLNYPATTSPRSCRTAKRQWRWSRTNSNQKNQWIRNDQSQDPNTEPDTTLYAAENSHTEPGPKIPEPERKLANRYRIRNGEPTKSTRYECRKNAEQAHPKGRYRRWRRHTNAARQPAHQSHGPAHPNRTFALTKHPDRNYNRN